MIVHTALASRWNTLATKRDTQYKFGGGGIQAGARLQTDARRWDLIGLATQKPVFVGASNAKHQFQG